MMTCKYSLSILAFSLSLVFISNAHAYGESPSIEDCSALLPEGQQYNVSIDVRIDKTGQQSKFENTFAIDDKVGKESQISIATFIECVEPLIKIAQEPISEEEERATLEPLFKGIVYK
ncbi:hypothetical protein L4C38_10770 [Vibrio kasasachensis]|uniref:hypothetical protein n=1 Tax=Vibrio kasasachensis TaxID=2910248 RepID=UPI003D0F66C1